MRKNDGPPTYLSSGSIQPLDAYCAGLTMSIKNRSIAESLALSTVDRYWRCNSDVAPPVSISTFTPGLALLYCSNNLACRSGRWLGPTNTRRVVCCAQLVPTTSVLAKANAASFKVCRFFIFVS